MLRGKISIDRIPDIIKLKPKKSLRIFVSSTFTDTHQERNILHEDILLKLQKQALQKDIQVTLYDMRFGVKDENTLDHMTWEICRDGIQQCADDSDGMFFLSLQGDKYGYCPLPKYIYETDLISILKQENVSNEDIQIIQNWYEIDSNSIPSRYVLKNLMEGTKKEFFDIVLPKLRDGCFDNLSFCQLSNVGTEVEGNESLLVNRSVTEWETLFALYLSKERCYWMKRMFSKESLKELSQNPADANKLWDHCDHWGTPSKQMKIEILKGKMESSIKGISSFLVDAQSYIEGRENEDCQKYLEEWKERVQNRLMEEIDLITQRHSSWEEGLTSLNYEIPIEYLEEIHHHQQIAFDKSNSFIGRDNLVRSVIERTNINVDPIPLVTLAVIGQSGTGKTALMAKVFRTLFSEERNKENETPFIIRFCGTSRLSMTGLMLIQTISLQLLLAYEKEEKIESLLDELSSQTYETAIKYFHGLLKRYPAYIFIDSLDQLSDKDEARSKLKFLLTIPKLHKESRIIVSTLPDEGEKGYLYFCEQRLKAANIPTIYMQELLIVNQGVNEQKIIFEEILKRRDRQISPDQWSVALSAFQAEPTILYINLAVEIIQKWKSFDQDISLRPTVKGIISQIFDDLERDYGKQFVSWAFSFITFSREGMSDLEMKDCLSLQEDVRKEVFQYSKIDTFPMHVWLRLRFIVKSLIVEKENHCIQWYHRQLWETAQERYQFIKANSHKILGEYFISQPLTLNQLVIWHDEAIVNTRRVREGYYHLMIIDLFQDAFQEICCLEFVYASALVEDTYPFMAAMGSLYKQVTEVNTIDSQQIQRLKDYYDWFRAVITTITKDPYPGVTITAGTEPLTSAVRQDLGKTKNKFQSSTFVENDIVWGHELNGNIRRKWDAKFIGHSNMIRCVEWGPTGMVFASASDDNTVKVWDATYGEVIHTLEGHKGLVFTVSWSPEGNQLVSGSEDKSIRIWDSITGNVIRCIENAHGKGSVHCLAWNPVDPLRLASGGRDSRDTKVWNPETGEVVYQIKKRASTLSWSRDGTKLAIADRVLHILDGSTGELLLSFPAEESQISNISWNSTGTKIVGAVSEYITIKIWDTSSGKELSMINVMQEIDHRGEGKAEGHEIMVAKWNNDDSLIACGCWGKSVRIIDAKTKRVCLIMNGHSEGVRTLSWKPPPKGNVLPPQHQLISGAEDSRVISWNVTESLSKGDETKKREQRRLPHEAEIEVVAFNPTGTMIATAGEQTLKIWICYQGTFFIPWVKEFGYPP